MNIDHQKDISWFMTPKKLLIDQTGETIGSYGISHHLERTLLALPGMNALKLPVDYIRRHYMEEILLHDLAQVSCLSINVFIKR